MSIDWTIAGDWAEQVHAVAMVESGGDPDAKGDLADAANPLTNKARGLFQWHPAAFQEDYGYSHLYPASPADTWVDADIKALAGYFERWITDGTLTFERALMCFHLGRKAVIFDGAWDAEYIGKYDRELNKLRAVKK